MNLYAAPVSNSILQACPEHNEIASYTYCYPHTSEIQNKGVSDMRRPESYSSAKQMMHSPCVYLQMQV